MDNILKHGGYMSPHSKKRLGMESISLENKLLESATDFDYMFPDLAADLESKLPQEDATTTIEHLKTLARTMVDAPPETPALDSTIPTIYTYWGQFIDHDVTANTDRNEVGFDITKEDFTPLDPITVTERLKNLRKPQLDLDSVYGDGPKGNAHLFYKDQRFRLGTVATSAGIPGQRIPDIDDLERDLPRIGTLLDDDGTPEDFGDLVTGATDITAIRKLAWIGDMRNDENTIVAQFHQAVLRFHNKVVDHLEDSTELAGDALFKEAKKLTTWHYQWLVINDYLKTITFPGVVDEILCSGRKFYDPENQSEFMPLEHSVAAFRFGHTMVRNSYEFNRNFSQDAGALTDATFNLLFQFTGVGGLGDQDTLPFNWVIEFDRFTNHGSSNSKQFARKVDTLLAQPLSALANEGNDIADARIREIVKHLAMRNLLRGYLLSIPTGQALAEQMDISLLSEEEIKLNNSEELNQAIDNGGFATKTPLWYYILKEAEVRANGNCLGELGSRIVAETFIGLIEKDFNSYRNKQWHHNWHPGLGVRLDSGKTIVTIRDFIEYAGLPI